MRTPHFILVAVLCAVPALSGTARADRFQRAEANFTTNCTGCHTIGWQAPAAPEKNKVDLTRVLDRSDEMTLRRFLEDPAAARSGSRCVHPPLVRLQIDDLLLFFRLHASPPPPAEQVVPPRSRLRKITDPPIRPSTTRTGAADPSRNGAAPTAPSPAVGR